MKSVILNELEWVREIFNYMHCTASLRQLSFLLKMTASNTGSSNVCEWLGVGNLAFMK